MHDLADDTDITTARVAGSASPAASGLRSPCGLGAATYRACEAERAALVALGCWALAGSAPSFLRSLGSALLCYRFETLLALDTTVPNTFLNILYKRGK